MKNRNQSDIDSHRALYGEDKKKKCWGCGFEVDEEEFALNGGYCDQCKESIEAEHEWMENHGYEED